MSRNHLRNVDENPRDSDTMTGVILLGIAAIVVVIIGYVYFSVASTRVVRDETLCRVDNFIPRETAVLLDATESFSDSQSMLITRILERELASSAVDERFTLYTLGSNEQGFKPMYSICNPGDGSDQSDLTANKRRLLENWKVNFFDKIVQSVEDLKDIEPAETSPIIEMLKFVSIQTMFDSSNREAANFGI